MQIWSIYLIRCNDRSLYTGITTDIARRFQEHQNTTGRGAKYLKGKGPLKLVWHAEIGDRSLALKLEDRVKKLSKKEKEQLAAGKIDLKYFKDILTQQTD
tara:strand:+ start:82 stop:381 length:300 start_codon:yes stop_codon:yes gene_type:complete